MKLIAFLRAVNVGGRVVKMADLKRIFESVGLSNVETFIASGNVVFETKSKDLAALERKIEKALQEGFGFKVDTFLRTEAEVAAIAAHQAFPQAAIDRAAAFNIGFLGNKLDATSQKKLMALRSHIDDLHVHEREVYWLCRVNQNDSKFSNAVLEKTLGGPSTIRGVNTVRKLAAKYCES